MIRWWVVVLALLAGCGEDVPRPAVTPLTADEAALQQLYKWGRGPWETTAETDLEIPHPDRDGPLSFNVYYPVSPADASSSAENPTTGEGKLRIVSDRDFPASLPVLLFSHGNWSTNGKYDKLIEHWVSHGYAVLAPLHLDGSGGYVSGTINLIRYGNLGLIQARVDDLVALLDALPEIEAMVPPLTGRLDAERIAATGHSFGAFNAQQLGGASALDTDSGSWVGVRDERIRAVVAISPPGPMFDEITDGKRATIGFIDRPNFDPVEFVIRLEGI